MGNNFAYTVFEETVVGAYDLGVLDKDLLVVLMEPYRGMDIDSGASRFLKSHDGLTVEEIVIKLWGMTLPNKPDFYDKPECDEATDQCDTYSDELYNLFCVVTAQFGWC